jgi:hypothetical protein
LLVSCFWGFGFGGRIMCTIGYRVCDVVDVVI